MQNAEIVLSPEGHLYLDTSPLAMQEISLHEFEKLKRFFENDPYVGSGCDKKSFCKQQHKGIPKTVKRNLGASV